MKKLLLLPLILLALASPANASHVTTPLDHCAGHQGNPAKIEANGGTQAAINSLVLAAGTQVCIKGSNNAVTVTADGTLTLKQLLGTGHDVSYYIILSVPTTTTTLPPTTTTTLPPVTTTTVPSVIVEKVVEKIVEVPVPGPTIEITRTIEVPAPAPAPAPSTELPRTGAGSVLAGFGAALTSLGLMLRGIRRLIK